MFVSDLPFFYFFTFQTGLPCLFFSYSMQALTGKAYLCIRMAENENFFAPALERWFVDNARDLPWRRTRDAYKIWVSEIILQQTRVAQGYDYYMRFVERFPDVQSLASAQDDEVMKYWQGLGYYSRARNMLAAARDVVTRFGGIFPSTYDDIRSLKGIGDYTAAAIASIAYDLPYAVLDGNVYRVLSRLFDIDLPIDDAAGKRYFSQLADTLLHRDNPGLYNQAMMELGALVCLPAGAACDKCPVASHCAAYAAGTVAQRPVKQGKVAVKHRYFHYFVIMHRGDTWLHRREGSDIWRNLYEFPLIETPIPLSLPLLRHTEAYKTLLGDAGKLTFLAPPFECKHVLTHRIIHAVFYVVEVEAVPPSLHDMRRMPWGEVGEYAVSRLTDIFLQHCAAGLWDCTSATLDGREK